MGLLSGAFFSLLATKARVELRQDRLSRETHGISAAPHRHKILARDHNVVTVPDSGQYASDWWWYYGVTIPEIQDFLVVNDARLVDVEVYQTKAGLRFATATKRV